MKKAKVLRNGQMVMLPTEFRLEDTEVYVKKSGSIVHLIPRTDCWDSLLQSLEKFSDDFMEKRVQPEVQKRDSI